MKIRNLSSVIIIFIIFGSVFTACGMRRSPEPELPALSLAEINGETLWRHIMEDSDYTQYREWSEHSGIQPGQSPHGVWHRVFGNRTLFDVLPISNSVAPDGTIIVKENFDSNKELRSITVMAKVRDWDSANGDWFWAMYAPDGTVNAEGSLNGCISCHEGMIDNDYVIINPLSEKP